jgi:hypothetical protein
MSDDRLKNIQPKEKTSKTVDDRLSRIDNLDEAGVEDLLRGTNMGGILPTPPAKPGFHRVWLSEQNQQNPISWYERLGYRKVDPSEVENFGQEYLKSPSGIEEVRCNELILYEVPDNIYQRIMKVYHHDMPLELQGKPVDDMRGKYTDPKTGESLFTDESDEYAREEARKRVPAPRFS